jgi:hypothetical protein
MQTFTYLCLFWQSNRFELFVCLAGGSDFTSVLDYQHNLELDWQLMFG